MTTPTTLGSRGNASELWDTDGERGLAPGMDGTARISEQN